MYPQLESKLNLLYFILHKLSSFMTKLSSLLLGSPAALTNAESKVRLIFHAGAGSISYSEFTCSTHPIILSLSTVTRNQISNTSNYSET